MRPSRPAYHGHSRHRVRLTYSEHVELGRQFKRLEQLIREITQTLADHVSSPLATSFRKRADKATEIKCKVENTMVDDIERAGQELPRDFGLAYYGPAHPDVEPSR